MRILIPGVVVPLIALLLYFLVPGVKERPWTVVRMAGAMIAVAAYVLVIAARIQLGTSFSVRPEARELVTHALYSRIRNPMYVFVDIMLAGLILALQLPWLLVIVAVLVLFQAQQVRREAAVLQEKFGRAYLEYRKQTWF